MKSLIIILTFTTLLACSKTDEMKEQHYNLDAALGFSISNDQNEDLLNPETPNHINAENIRLFYVINGRSQEYYEENLDYPKGFLIGESDGIYRIRIFLNHAETENKAITYVEWNDTDTDTIEVSYKRTQNSILQDTIWLNGEQIWERGDNTTDPYFKLEK